MSNTIVAIATASGVASISIIRLSGDNALKIGLSLTKKRTLNPRYAHLTTLYNSQKEIIDEAIVIYFKSPNSFTGEDIVEFQCHGGVVVANMIVESCLFYGASLAKAGEFSKRAFLNGKIDLTKAEAIAKLIEVKSVDGAKIIARQLKGELEEFIQESRALLLNTLAHIEVLIDYAEDNSPKQDELLKVFNKLTQKIDKVIETSNRKRGVIDGFKVAIIGKPNVGKSSLLNSLLSYDRAIVSNIAGTTRDTIEEQIKIGTHLIKIVDTAGIREAEDKIEQIGIKRSHNSIDEAEIVIALFDNSSKFSQEDEKILSLLRNKKSIIVLNKYDLKQEFNIEEIAKYNPLKLSLKENITPLTKKLEEILNSIMAGDELMLISLRQIDAMQKTQKAINEAKEPLINGELEFCAYHIKEALEELSSILRPFQYEEILDTMFSQFCLGK